MIDSIPLNPPQKQCTTCLKWKDATPYYFNISASGRYGVGSLCKVCKSLAHKAKHPNAKTYIVDAPPPPDGFKRCTKCSKELPATLEYFGRFRDGLRPRCNQCKAEDDALYCETHKDAQRERSRAYEVTRHDKRLAYRRKRRHITNARRREQYSTNPLVRESRLESSRKDNINHQERQTATRRRYEQTTNGKAVCKVRAHNRRMRLQGLPSTLTAEQVLLKLRLQKFRCYYCSTPLEERKGKYVYHLDHTIPVARTEANPRNDMSHTVLTCPHCNLLKSNKLPHEWAQGGRLM